MRTLLLHILRALVQQPEGLDLTEVTGSRSIYYELRCAPGDVGIVIGKNGKTISAIRTLLNALAHAQEKPVVFEVIEPND